MDSALLLSKLLRWQRNCWDTCPFKAHGVLESNEPYWPGKLLPASEMNLIPSAVYKCRSNGVAGVLPMALYSQNNKLLCGCCFIVTLSLMWTTGVYTYVLCRQRFPLRCWLASSFQCVPAVHVQVYQAHRAPYDQTYNAGRAVTRHDRSLASFQAIGEMAWQLVQVETMNGCNLTAIATSHSSSEYWIIACDTFFYLWERGFPGRGSKCLQQVLLLKWSRSHLNKNDRAEHVH